MTTNLDIIEHTLNTLYTMKSQLTEMIRNLEHIRPDGDLPKSDQVTFASLPDKRHHSMQNSTSNQFVQKQPNKCTCLKCSIVNVSKHDNRTIQQGMVILQSTGEQSLNSPRFSNDVQQSPPRDMTPSTFGNPLPFHRGLSRVGYHLHQTTQHL